MVHIRLSGGGLRDDGGRAYRIFKALSSIRGHDRVCIDSSTVEAKRGDMIGYDGFKHRRGLKIMYVWMSTLLL